MTDPDTVQQTTSTLSKLRSPGGCWEEATGVYHVTSPHTLTQAAGYLKYVYRETGPVLFRGQPQIYPSFRASLHRGVSSAPSIKKREGELGAFRNASRKSKAFLDGTPDYAHDAILQHYGIRTQWLDVVDNIWIALWFACHDAISLGGHGEFLHLERRRVSGGSFVEPDGKGVGAQAGTATRPKYAYILLVHATGVTPVKDHAGLQRGPYVELLDLRAAAPSLYLRPHAQHGLLFRRVNPANAAAYDLKSNVVGTIRVDLENALEWLGTGRLLDTHALFPPPYYDYGYRALLERCELPGHRYLSSLFSVGA